MKKLIKVLARYLVAFIIFCISIYTLVLADDFGNRAVVLGFYLASLFGIILAIVIAGLDVNNEYE